MIITILLNSSLAILGGRQGKLPTASFEVLDLVTGKWQILPQIPSKRIFISFVYADSYIYSIGGMDVKGGANKMMDTLEIFDLKSGMFVDLLKM